MRQSFVGSQRFDPAEVTASELGEVELKPRISEFTFRLSTGVVTIVRGQNRRGKYLRGFWIPEGRRTAEILRFARRIRVDVLDGPWVYFGKDGSFLVHAKDPEALLFTYDPSRSIFNLNEERCGFAQEHRSDMALGSIHRRPRKRNRGRELRKHSA